MIDGIETKIERTKRRKTIGFEILPGNSLRILVPDSIDDEKLERVIHHKKGWIYQKVEEANKILLNQKNREFVSGESFPLLGKEYRLQILKDVDGLVSINGDRLIVPIGKNIKVEDHDDLIRAKLISFYKIQSKEKLIEVAERFSRKLGVEFKNFDIKDYKKSWGMCSKDGEVFINWKVVMAPISVVNYVVAHEICHLVYPDHTKHFWSLVSSLVGNVEDSKKWLKYNQLYLDI